METQTNYTTSSTPPSAKSDKETSYTTISSAPPKRRAGRTKFRETRHPTFKGVRCRNANRWVCEVREPNKKSRIWLGTFPTPEMAARAHDVAAMALRGQSACLNFADSAWLLPMPESNSPRDIQRAAALAAEAFRPQSSDMMRANVVNDDYKSGQGEISSVGRSDGFLFADEMQGYFDDMGQGMLIDPPQMLAMTLDDFEGESDGEMSLWSYSI